MKKKQPTLTHYTKRLKKVRLARTITVIATLFVSGIVVAANVLPQVIKSNASKTPDTTNDVINGGVNIWDGDTAKTELKKAVFNTDTNEAKSAKALYAKFGVDQKDIDNATFEWLYGPKVTGKKVATWEPINGPADKGKNYAEWNSFGRNNGSGFTPYPVAYPSNPASLSPADFFYKTHYKMLELTGSWQTETSAEPVLMGNGWYIVLTCGNIVVKTIPAPPAAPTISFEKDVVAVTRAKVALKPEVFKAKDFKLQLKDQIRYRLRGTNGAVNYPAGIRLIDEIPAGTKLATDGQGDAHDWDTTVTKVAGAKVGNNPAVAWDFKEIPARDSGYTDFVVEVTSVTSSICNFAYYGKPGDIPWKTNQICLGTGKPVLKVEKVAKPAPTSVKVGDKITYEIKLTNEGSVEAPGAVALDILKRDGLTNEKTQRFVGISNPVLKVSGATKSISENTDYQKIVTQKLQDQYANKNYDAFGIRLTSMPADSVMTFTVTAEITKVPTAVKVDGKDITESCDFAIASMTGSAAYLGIEAKSAQVCIPVFTDDKPHITVTKTSPTANRDVARGQTINYSIVVKNTTKAAQTTPVTVTDTFIPGGIVKDIKEVSHTGTLSGPDSIANGLKWTIPSMPGNSSITINMRATVVDTAADNTEFCNNATITMTPGHPVVSETSSSVCNKVSLIKKSKTAKYVDRSDDPQKVAANAGDKIQYTLTTTNQASVEAKDYIVVEDLADVMYYAEIDMASLGGATLTGTKLTWPAKSIPAGGKITNTFTVTVKDPVPNNEPSIGNPTNYDYNMFNFYGNDVNIKVNKPIIDRIIDVATNLPDTGAASYALVVLFLGMSVYFFVRNKQLTSELAAATVEYQHQASAGSLEQAQNLIHPEEPDVTNPTPPTIPPAA